MPRDRLKAQWHRALRFALFADGHCTNAEAARRASIAEGTVRSWMTRDEDLKTRAAYWRTDPPSIESSLAEVLRGDFDERDDPRLVIPRLRAEPWIEDEIASQRRGEAPGPEMMAEWD